MIIHQKNPIAHLNTITPKNASVNALVRESRKTVNIALVWALTDCSGIQSLTSRPQPSANHLAKGQQFGRVALRRITRSEASPVVSGSGTWTSMSRRHPSKLCSPNAECRDFATRSAVLGVTQRVRDAGARAAFPVVRLSVRGPPDPVRLAAAFGLPNPPRVPVVTGGSRRPDGRRHPAARFDPPVSYRVIRCRIISDPGSETEVRCETTLLHEEATGSGRVTPGRVEPDLAVGTLRHTGRSKAAEASGGMYGLRGSSRGGEVAAVDIACLGPMTLKIDGRPVAVGGPKQRAVLGMLVLHVGEFVSVDQLTEVVWGTSLPRNPRAVLQVYVTNLRRMLGDDRSGSGARLTNAAGGYRLSLDADAVDWMRFDRLTQQAEERLFVRRGRPRRRPAALCTRAVARICFPRSHGD